MTVWTDNDCTLVGKLVNIHLVVIPFINIILIRIITQFSKNCLHANTMLSFWFKSEQGRTVLCLSPSSWRKQKLRWDACLCLVCSVSCQKTPGPKHQILSPSTSVSEVKITPKINCSGSKADKSLKSMAHTSISVLLTYVQLNVSWCWLLNSICCLLLFHEMTSRPALPQFYNVHQIAAETCHTYWYFTPSTLKYHLHPAGV